MVSNGEMEKKNHAKWKKQKKVTGQSHFKLQQNAGEIRENEKKSKNLPDRQRVKRS